MFFKQFYLGCLAHASYLIGSEGEAAVVDPQRDVEMYLSEAQAQGLALKYIIETHLHADFVSGHRELAARTGATIVFGHKANALFPHRAVVDGDELQVGAVTLKILETPGHTPEGISIVVSDTSEAHAPAKVLTGDTLFIGDVGRPDLVGSKGFSSEEMAGMLYDSLHQKLLTLDDSVEVYPAHGAGSLCGKNLSTETSSTIGDQRRLNYALKPMSRAAFVAMMTADLPEVPAYFPLDAEINRTGASPLVELGAARALTPEEGNKLIQQGYLVLDTRPAPQFGSGYIPGSLNIGLKGQFASWAGSLIPLTTPLLLVVESPDQVTEAVTRLARVGIETVGGYLAGGIDAWKAAGLELKTVPQLSVHALASRLEAEPDLQVVDVRRPLEFCQGHVPTALNFQLAQLEKNLDHLDPARPTAVICAGGYRSSAGASLLSRHGFHQVLNIVGGTAAWIQAGLKVEAEIESAACS
ncbi:MAG TPA: MBL fold metallo-hydrolase [Acidobacteriota bacterium]|nr:MBL fold metallo-hydrolase [Acidobacteriota bacterium]